MDGRVMIICGFILVTIIWAVESTTTVKPGATTEGEDEGDDDSTEKSDFKVVHNYPYNVTINVGSGGISGTLTGKLGIIFLAHGKKHEVKLTNGKSISFKPSKPYSFFATAPVTAELIDGVILRWTPNLMSKGRSLQVKYVTLDPIYATESRSSASRFCGKNDKPVNVWGNKANFDHECPDQV